MGGRRSTHIFCHAVCADDHLYAEDWKGKPHSTGESNEVRKWEYFFYLLRNCINLWVRTDFDAFQIKRTAKGHQQFN